MKYLILLLFASCQAIPDRHQDFAIKYNMPEEMPISDKGDMLEVYKRDTAGRTITIYLQFINPKDFQIELTQDSSYIYDRQRLVATVPISWDAPNSYDSVFMADNL